MFVQFVLEALSLRSRIALLNVACILPTVLVAAACGVQHLPQVALAAVISCFLSSLILPFAFRYLVLSQEEGIVRLRAMANGDSPDGSAARKHDRLGQAIGGLATSLETRAERAGRACDELKQLNRQLMEAVDATGRGGKELSGLSAHALAAARQLSWEMQEAGAAAGQLGRSAADSSAAIVELAASGENVAKSAENLVQVELQLHTTLDEMVENIGQAKAGIVELAESTLETSSRIFNMDESIARVEATADETASISHQVLRDAREGQSAVASTLEGMREIDLHSVRAAQVIGGLSGRVDSVGNILNVIQDVADQTALLSLNAAIIAAQAGEQGKGFAVVSQEIKMLASRTRESAKEIAAVIAGVQDDTEQAVQAIHTAVKSVKAGEALALKADETLEQIVLGVGNATERVAGIAAAAKEQAASSEVIRDSTEQISRTICEISGVLCFLGDESEQIQGAADRIGALVAQLQRATREQSLASSHIAGSAGETNEAIGRLEKALGAQQQDAEGIVYHLERILGTVGQEKAATGAAPEGLGNPDALSRELPTEFGAAVIDAGRSGQSGAVSPF